MAEYWKSAPRFWCKQCKIFIRDTPFEKTQHEASPKHQGSLKRFLREIHKNNEIQQKESQRAKSEVERLRQAVGGGSPAPKPDGSAASAKRTAVPAAKPAERPISIEERKKQMAQLAEMGVAIPQEYRADMALAGEWQTMSETKLESAEDLESAAKSIGVRKRKHEGDEEEDEHAPEPIERKGWGSRMKTYPGVTDDDEDLDALLASTKDIKRSKAGAVPSGAVDTAEKSEVQQEGFAPVPKTEAEGLEPGPAKAQTLAAVKSEETEDSTGPSVPPGEEKPWSEETPGIVFKKRKAKVIRK